MLYSFSYIWYFFRSFLFGSINKISFRVLIIYTMQLIYTFNVYSL